ncbi:MAG: DUF2986 domain-containing protein [Gammaproteobacteria bacterium]|nr:DUF2986 domain-containing protein [Gammaproteobacteria bacterium]MBQ0840367.1 DUF2986 domain-containing protein [Gammaproteobacteria bacterium]
MNRKKKINAVFNKKLKKAKARMNPSSKPKYLSKAERAKLETAPPTTGARADIKAEDSDS